MRLHSLQSYVPASCNQKARSEAHEPLLGVDEDQHDPSPSTSVGLALLRIERVGNSEAMGGKQNDDSASSPDLSRVEHFDPKNASIQHAGVMWESREAYGPAGKSSQASYTEFDYAVSIHVAVIDALYTIDNRTSCASVLSMSVRDGMSH